MKPRGLNAVSAKLALKSIKSRFGIEKWAFFASSNPLPETASLNVERIIIFYIIFVFRCPDDLSGSRCFQ
jgi:hypothetical protein